MSKPILSALAVLPLAVAAHSYAQGEDRLEEVVVRAEKLGRTLQETTTSIAVFTGEELEQRSIIDLYDVVLRTPNVSSSFGQKGFAIRGVDQRLGGGAGLLVNTIVDGAALPNNQSTFFGPYSTWDIGQVEVLRGPQGTTQGRNAIGGAIVINTADAEFNEFGGRVRGQYGELDSYQTAGALNIPMVDDKLAARFAVDKRETDGWVRNPTRGEDYDPRDFLNLRGKLRWAASEDLELRYTISYTDSTGGEDLVDFFQFPDRRVNLSDGPAEEGSEHLINTLQAYYRINDAWSLTAIATFYEHDYVRIEDIDNSAEPLSFLDREQEDDSQTFELRANYDNGGPLRGIVGVYAGNFDNQSVDNLSISVAFLGIPPPVLEFLGIDPFEQILQQRDFRNEEENRAVFTEWEYDLSDRFTLIGGFRYDDEERDIRNETFTTTDVTLPFPLPPDEVIRTNAEYDAFLPKLGARYRLTEDIVLGATAQKAYRAGGVGVAIVSGELNEFDPEEAWTYELSVRASLFDQRHQVSGNLFYTDWQDQQVNRTSDFGRANGVPLDTVPDNAGESRLFGGELSIDSNWFDGFTTFAAIGYLDTQFDEYDGDTFEYTGNEFPYAPEWTLALGFNYQHPSGFVVSGDVNWSDEFFSAETNDPNRVEFEPIFDTEGNEVGQRETCSARPCNDPATTVDDYWVVNLKLGYVADNWSAYLFGRNVFDEDYATQVTAVSFNDITGDPEQSARTAEPRVLGVEVNYSW